MKRSAVTNSSSALEDIALDRRTTKKTPLRMYTSVRASALILGEYYGGGTCSNQNPRDGGHHRANTKDM